METWPIFCLQDISVDACRRRNEGRAQTPRQLLHPPTTRQPPPAGVGTVNRIIWQKPSTLRVPNTPPSAGAASPRLFGEFSRLASGDRGVIRAPLQVSERQCKRLSANAERPITLYTRKLQAAPNSGQQQRWHRQQRQRENERRGGGTVQREHQQRSPIHLLVVTNQMLLAAVETIDHGRWG